MKTEFFVDYDLFDTTALEDAAKSSDDNSAFADLTLLKHGVDPVKYGTLEHNFFVLDETASEFPDDPEDIAFFSTAQAGPDGEFDDPPVLIIDFTENHTSIGLTFHFAEEYPLEMEIAWKDLDGNVIDRKKFYPDNTTYFCRNQVVDYGGLEITFLRALPYHNVKLNAIKYGTTFSWGSDKIKTGKLINDTDPVSNTIKTDKLTFEFVDVDGEFDLGNDDGLHRVLQKTQRMYPYEVVLGKKIPLGTFFLDDNSTTKSLSKITAIDYKGILAKSDFKAGRIYNGDSAGDIIAEIMAAAGITEYTVDDETAATPLYGTLKIQTCQKALREVLFACGSVIKTSHIYGIEIQKASRSISGKITRSQKFSTTIQTDTYVSDVSVKYKTWILDQNVSEITKGTYSAGTHEIQLTNPAANMETNAGTITEQTPYYIVLQLDIDAEVVITGQKYTGTELSALARIEHIKAGEVRNAKTFSGTLLDYKAAQRVASSILDYYQLRQIIKTKHLSDAEKVGDWMEIENAVEKRGGFTACIESMTTDLTGGFICAAKYRGYYKQIDINYYCDEFYLDEDIGTL